MRPVDAHSVNDSCTNQGLDGRDSDESSSECESSANNNHKVSLIELFCDESDESDEEPETATTFSFNDAKKHS